MDNLTRILRDVPVIHPATVGRLFDWPKKLKGDALMKAVCRDMGEAWAQIHQRPATTHDVLTWARKQVPMQWIAVILWLDSEQIPGIWDEIDAMVARGVISPLPEPVDDPGAAADFLLRRSLFHRL
jgi:hypothetical protein